MGKIRGWVRDQGLEMGRIKGGIRDQGVEMGRIRGGIWIQLLPLDFVFCSDREG